MGKAKNRKTLIREFKQIATADASTAIVTEEVWGEYVGQQSKPERNIYGGGKYSLFYLHFSQVNVFVRRNIILFCFARTKRLFLHESYKLIIIIVVQFVQRQQQEIFFILPSIYFANPIPSLSRTTIVFFSCSLSLKASFLPIKASLKLCTYGRKFFFAMPRNLQQTYSAFVIDWQAHERQDWEIFKKTRL